MKNEELENKNKQPWTGFVKSIYKMSIEQIEALKLARKQRFKSLQNALDTVKEFAIPSLNPEQFQKFEDVEQDLLSNYGSTDSE